MTYANYFNASPGWEFLLQGKSGRADLLDIDPIAPRRHDWPSLGFIRGEVLCDCCMMTQPPGPTSGAAALHFFSFNPFGSAIPSRGDGGNICVVTDDGWLKIIATQDGSRPGLYYFVGGGAPQDGWLLGRADDQLGWQSTIGQIAQASPPGNLLNGLGPVYTRWTTSLLDVPMLTAGSSPTTFQAWCLVSEHYNGADPASSVSMERFVFGRYWGLLRWEAWGSGSTPDYVLERAPPMALAYPNQDAASNMTLLDARTFTNFFDDEVFHVWPDAGWPVGVQLPPG